MQHSKRLRIRSVISLFLSYFTAATARASRQAADADVDGDAQVVSRARVVAAGELIKLHEDGIKVDPAFLQTLEDAYRRIEKLLDRPFDKKTLGSPVRVYVTDAQVVSHVWNGYGHPRDPRGILFLNRTAYKGAVQRTNATFAHELTHLFTWRFHSHTLREGLADYIALTLYPGTAVGPNQAGYDLSANLPADVLDVLGTTAAPPSWVRTDRRMRALYYAGSYRLVKLLIAQGGLPKFLELYGSPDPEQAYLRLYGVPRAALLKGV